MSDGDRVFCDTDNFVINDMFNYGFMINYDDSFKVLDCRCQMGMVMKADNSSCIVITILVYEDKI